jgi:hypothetical protein
MEFIHILQIIFLSPLKSLAAFYPVLTYLSSFVVDGSILIPFSSQVLQAIELLLIKKFDYQPSGPYAQASFSSLNPLQVEGYLIFPQVLQSSSHCFLQAQCNCLIEDLASF